jgi:lipoic acid synthetase
LDFLCEVHADRMEAPRSTRPETPSDLPVPGTKARTPKPAWLKVPLPGGEGYTRLKALTRELGLHTVCEEARCPNIGECWKGEHATMTLMVLGDECTRRCRFCAVKTVERAAPPDPDEPRNVGRGDRGAEGGLRRDHQRRPRRPGRRRLGALRRVHPPGAARGAEHGGGDLDPDYQGSDLATLMAGRPDVLAHNVEVVGRLQRKIRDPRCTFERSLATLRGAKELDPGVFTKSSIMLGLGETHEELVESMQLLRAAGVEFLTLGQYLRPTLQHAPVREYVPPERFDAYQRLGLELGFQYVASGPLVRSSYKAGEFFAARLVRERRAQDPGTSQARSA